MIQTNRPQDRAHPADTRDDPTALRLPEHYESTTLGGLVSEIAGHIPLPGEVVEEDGLRLEVLASTDRRIDRIRVSLIPSPCRRMTCWPISRQFRIINVSGAIRIESAEIW